MMVRTAAVLVLSAFMASASAGELRGWLREYPEAHRALLKCFEGRPNFRAKFATVLEESPLILEDLIVFLAAKGDRNIGDFTAREGRDARPIKQLRENYAEHLRDFREWVRDHRKAALELTEIPGGLRGAFNASRDDKRGRDR